MRRTLFASIFPPRSEWATGLGTPNAAELDEMTSQAARKRAAQPAKRRTYKCDVNFCAYCCCWGTRTSFADNYDGPLERGHWVQIGGEYPGDWNSRTEYTHIRESIVDWWRPKLVGKYFTALLTQPACQVGKRVEHILKGNFRKAIELPGFCERRCRDCEINPGRYNQDVRYHYNQCPESASFLMVKSYG